MRAHRVMEKFRRRSGLAGLALLGLLCRALIPAGFMPAAIGAGGPIAVCHGGLAGEFFRELAESRRDDGHGGADARHDRPLVAGDHADHAAHADHADHAALADQAGAAGVDVAAGADVTAAASDTSESPAGAHPEGWENCPFGAAFGAALVAADFEPALLTLAHALETSEPVQPVALQPASSYRARAPPIFAIHV